MPVDRNDGLNETMERCDEGRASKYEHSQRSSADEKVNDANFV